MGLRPYFASLLCACTPLLASAGSPELALKLAKVLGTEAQYEESHAQCLKTNRSVPPEKLLNISDENPGPVSPGSRLWPMVVAAYDNYWEEVCARPTREEFLQATAASYAKSLGDADLEAALGFYATPVGARLVEAGTVMVKDVLDEWQRLNAAALPRAIRGLNARLEAIGEEAARTRCREAASARVASRCSADESPKS